MSTKMVAQVGYRTGPVLERQWSSRRGSIGLILWAFFACLAVVFPPPIPAQESNSITRADPVTFWDFGANPAAQAFTGDVFSLAFRGNLELPMLDGQPKDSMQNLDLGIGFGGLRYTSLQGTDNPGNTLASALGLRSFGAGLGVSWADGEKLTGPDSRYDFGILYRPYNLLSVGLTLEDAFADVPAWGAGLALRPFASWPQLESILTLSADARLQDGTTRIQNIATRLRLGSWLGLKAWVEPDSWRIGFQAHLRLGASESELILPDAGGDLYRAVFASAL